MKTAAIAAIAIMLLGGTAHAQSYVDGHIRSDGTYVAPHFRSSPNSSTYDNWSTKGNANPFTGQSGSRDPTPSYGSSSYGSSLGSGGNGSSGRSLGGPGRSHRPYETPHRPAE